MPGRITVSQHSHRLVPVQHPVAGGTVADAPAQEFRLSGEFLPPVDTGRQNDSRGVFHVAVHTDIPSISHVDGIQYLSLPEFRARILRVAAHGRQQLCAGHAGQADVVVHPFRPPQGIFLQRIGHHQDAPSPGADVQRRG